MIELMTYLVLMILASWVLREVCGLIDRRQRKARGDRK